MIGRWAELIYSGTGTGGSMSSRFRVPGTSFSAATNRVFRVAGGRRAVADRSELDGISDGTETIDWDMQPIAPNNTYRPELT